MTCQFHRCQCPKRKRRPDTDRRKLELFDNLLIECKKIISWFKLMKEDHHEKLVEHQTFESASENWNSLIQEPLDLEPLMKILTKAAEIGKGEKS